MSELQPPPPSRRTFAIGVSLALVLHLALLAWAGPGYMCSDDQAYIGHAVDMVNGSFAVQFDHWSNRLGVIAPTALAYRVLGISPWTTLALPIASSLASIVLCACAARTAAGDRAGALTALLLAPTAFAVNLSAFLMPDGIVAMAMTATVALVWAGRCSRHATWLGIAAAAAVTFGVLVKLTAIWVAPFLLWVLVRDLARRRSVRFWATFAITGVAFALVYFAIYHVTTGDALYRMHAIESGHNRSHWAIPEAAAGGTLARITYLPAAEIFDKAPDLALFAAAAIPLLLGWRRATEAHRYWLGYALTVTACFWIGSTSPTTYAPMPLITRMFATSLLPAAIVAGISLTAAGRSRAGAVAIGALLAAAIVAVIALDRPLAAAAYVAGGVVLAVRFWPAGRPARWTQWSNASLVVLLAAMCAYGVFRGGVGASKGVEAEWAIAQELASLADGDVVVTDRASARTIPHYLGQAVPASLPLLVWDDVAAAPEPPYVIYYSPGRWSGPHPGRAPPAWVDDALGLDSSSTLRRAGNVRVVRVAGPDAPR